jgi:hypothetical protein
VVPIYQVLESVPAIFNRVSSSEYELRELAMEYVQSSDVLARVANKVDEARTYADFSSFADEKVVVALKNTLRLAPDFAMTLTLQNLRNDIPQICHRCNSEKPLKRSIMTRCNDCTTRRSRQVPDGAKISITKNVGPWDLHR